MRLIDPDEILPHLNIGRLIEPMRRAMIAYASGKATCPITVLHPTDRSDMHVKSATMDSASIFTVKMAGWSNARANAGLTPTTGKIAVYDSETCELQALLNDEHLISDYRTAAMGALLAEGLARADASVLTVIGTGTQARLQARAVCLVRDITRIEVWGRDPNKASRLSGQLQSDTGIENIDNTDDLKASVQTADIVVCATSAREPILHGSWLKPGQHITSVGADDATKVELALDCLERADIIAVDSFEASQHYGNLRQACARPDITAKVAEIGDLLTADCLCRSAEDQISCASLVGLGVQDLATVVELEKVLW